MRVLFLGELFVLFLLLPVVFRTFIKKRNKVDTSVIFSLFAFIVMILLTLAKGLSFSVFAVAIPCLFIFIFNLRSLGRCFQQLKTDVYSAGAIIVSLLGILLIAGAGYLIIRFYPVSTFRHLNSRECEAVEIIKKNQTGSFAEGFSQISSVKEPVTAVLYKFIPYSVYSNQQDENELPVVLFIPDVYTSVNENSLTIESITRKGNVVLCADFYAKDNAYLESFWNFRVFRSFALQAEKLKNEAENIPQNQDQLDRWRQIKTAELKMLAEHAKEAGLFERIALIVADGNASLAAKDFCKAENLDIPVFELNENIPGYISGMGNFAVNQPAVYTFVAKAPSDGWIQSQQIALRAEKAKLVQIQNADAGDSASSVFSDSTEEEF